VAVDDLLVVSLASPLRRRSLLALLGVLVVLAVAACNPLPGVGAPVATAPATSASADTLAKPPVPSRGAYLGASASVLPGESRVGAIERTEWLLGRGLAIDHQFYKWDQPLVSSTQEADAAAGRFPFVSWKPQRSDGRVVTWGSVAAGAVDAEIRAQAAAAREFGHPMFATFHHEPTDQAGHGWGTPAEFRAAFRHVVEVFRAEGAHNVAWVLVLTSWDYTQGRGEAFYPGDDVVDWVAADPYNWHQRDGRWTSLEEVARDFYEWGSATGKPLMLAEWGSTEDPARPARKAAWVDEALATLASWPNVKAAVYFNNLHGGYDWRVDTSPSALKAFRNLAHHPHFNPDAAPAQATPAPAPTSPETTAPRAPSKPGISFVGADRWADNARSHTVTVPAGVTDGDGLLLLLSSNNPAASISAPTGGASWHLLGTVDTGSIVTKVWRARAGADSAGQRVRIGTSDYAKVDLTLLAYRGTATDPVAALRGVPQSGSSRVHDTPPTPVVLPGSWVVSYWAHKDSASTRGLVGPDGVTTRSSGLGAGGGRIATLVADSAGPVPTGTTPALRATADAPSRQSTMWTIVLRPA
jgi:hypothetical protein